MTMAQATKQKVMPSLARGDWGTAGNVGDLGLLQQREGGTLRILRKGAPRRGENKRNPTLGPS